MPDHHGLVVLLTGLSGAGKTTLAHYVAEHLRLRDIPVCILDGDDLRHGLCSDLGYSLIDRTENVRRIAHVAKLISEAQVNVMVAIMCPLNQMRAVVRSINPNMLEVYVDAPLHICVERDTKGLYGRAIRGEIGDFSGINSLFERPSRPDVICKTEFENVTECGARILDALFDRGINAGH